MAKEDTEYQIIQHAMYATAHPRPQLLPVEIDKSGGGRIAQESDGASGGTRTFGRRGNDDTQPGVRYLV
jgi:hypothetical protein